MRDCDNITQNNQLIKVKGLTRRRRAEMALFRTPYK
jgi:GH24 family phage-related lysozyme (muramidase)